MKKKLRFSFASIICVLSLASIIYAQSLTPAEQFRHFVPVDKNLSRELLRDLSKRGSTRVYRGQELQPIAMPVGGITTGTFYLGGDGIVTVDPRLSSKVDHGFAIVAEVDGNNVLKHLKGQDFSDIEFVGEYPIGKVHYAEEGFPLRVEMEAFSPFIPLSTKQSALPGTLLHITVENTIKKPLRAGVLGWLQSGSDSRIVNKKNRTMIVHAGDEKSASKTDTLVLTLDGQGASSQVVGELLSLAKKKSTALATQSVELAAGEKKTFTFVLSWFFPTNSEGNEYTNRFESASEVAHYLLDNHEQLASDTRTWHRTYYEDSTLPRWLLFRLHSTVSTLATGTCQWRKNGRFWGWEGERSHGGTCIHVWHYAHAVGRLFPELERSAREMQDFAPGMFNSETGLVSMRGEHYPTRYYAADGQCGTILRAYREHQVSADHTFLERNWPHIKKALEFSINHDANKDMRVWRDELGGFPVEYSVKEDGKPDGIIEGMQPQTWDGYFHGPNTMVGSLYLAALRAGEEMAREMGDEAFAKHCREIFESGSRLTTECLWDGEYFIQLVDLEKHKKGQYGKGCNSDQVFGQGWAHHVGLGYLYPDGYVKQALQSVWKYNWAPDVGPQHAAHPPFRSFANSGEAGLFTCTWPKSPNMDKLSILGGPPAEVFTGIEYQVAGNMVWEGLLTEALAICHGVDERYQPPKRNPFNEVEAGNHYSRAMASWGVFTALAGYEYHGPKGHLGFAPRITPENFQAAFTAAEGWGSFTQKREADTQRNRIEIRWGKLRLESLAFTVSGKAKSCEVTVRSAGKAVQHTFALDNGRLKITLSDTLILKEGQAVDVTVSYP